MITFEQIFENEQIKTYIRKADDALRVLGFTEHSFAHVGKVARQARDILLTLGYPERTAELAQIAGYRQCDQPRRSRAKRRRHGVSPIGQYGRGRRGHRHYYQRDRQPR